MTTEEKVLSMRYNEFGFAKLNFFYSDKDVFPNQIHVVKWVETDQMEIYDTNEGKMVIRNSFCFAIGTMEWNEHEEYWNFRLAGTRYLEYGTEGLSKWLLDFCDRYKVKDGVLVEVPV